MQHAKIILIVLDDLQTNGYYKNTHKAFINYTFLRTTGFYEQVPEGHRLLLPMLLSNYIRDSNLFHIL